MNTPALIELEKAVTARAHSFFSEDVRAHSPALRDAIHRRSILVVGGGGSIGSATTRALLALGPAQLDVVDISENYLAELVRDLRSSGVVSTATEFRTHVFDYGAPAMHRFLADSRRFDAIFNFAAIKHVRSERDVYSLLHMLDVNIVRQARFKHWLADLGHRGSYFTVSTDKAANPSSLMGASKRVMEDVAFDIRPQDFDRVNAARFANVTFSNGSLLQGFLARIEKRQPLAVPADTRRFFVTHGEAAEICMLTALAAPSAHVIVPTLEPESHLVRLQDVAERVLTAFGYAATFTDDEAMAMAGMARAENSRCWPVLLTPLDTAGEKPYEEFVGEGEHVVDAGFASLQAIPRSGVSSIEAGLGALARLVDDPTLTIAKGDIVALLREMVPAMRHRESSISLDARM